MSHHQRRSSTVGLAAVVLAAVLALVSCSSTGGRPRSSDNGMTAGTADTPRVTVAMITHGVPGNAFWDLVRKGAETAAALVCSSISVRTKRYRAVPPANG